MNHWNSYITLPVRGSHCLKQRHELSRTTTTTTTTTATKMDVPPSFFSLQTVLWSGCVTAALLSALFVVQRERRKRYDECACLSVIHVGGWMLAHLILFHFVVGFDLVWYRHLKTQQAVSTTKEEPPNMMIMLDKKVRLPSMWPHDGTHCVLGTTHACFLPIVSLTCSAHPR